MPSPAQSKLLLVAAARFECEPAARALAAAGRAVEIHEVGVGPLAAAKSAAAAARAAAGCSVIFLGTCGTFGSFRGVSLVRATAAHWLPACERAEIAYQVAGTAPPITLPDPPAVFRHLPPRVVICGPTISTRAPGPRRIAAEDAVENLELYAVAAELAAAADDFVALLGITNAVGPAAHQDWRTHHGAAAALTASTVVAALTNCGA